MKEITKFKTVDEYFSSLPREKREILGKMRKAIKKSATGTEELISYNMPAFKYNGMLVYYAAHKEHIGFYPVSTAISAFEKDLSGYERTKGTIKFSLGKKLPLKLISRIIKFRVKENLEKQKRKIEKAEKMKKLKADLYQNK